MNEIEKQDLARFVIDTRDGVVKVVESRFNAILARIAPDMLDPLCALKDPWHGTPLWEVDVAQFHGLWDHIFNAIHLRLQWPESYGIGMTVRLRPYPRGNGDTREMLVTLRAFARLEHEGFLLRFDEVARRGVLRC